MKALRHVPNIFLGQSPLRVKKLIGVVQLNAVSYHALTEHRLDPVCWEWCERAFPKIIKLTQLLKDYDLINERLVNVHDRSIVNGDFLMQSMHTFKSLGTAFLRCHSMQQASCTGRTPSLVGKPIYSEPFAVDSLQKVCNILDVSAQQRKLVRLAICPQVTQHQIWAGALEEILNQLKSEIAFTDYLCMTKEANMVQQIVVNCLRFLDDTVSYDPDSTSWMRPAPKKDAESPPSAKWEDLLEMFNDLINYLKHDREFLFYVSKLEIMKEGLLQIKDVLVDKNIGYKEARHQQSLVQKKLTKSLGHSSRCLFTLLLYYLDGSVRDVELDICCWFSEDVAGNKFYLCVGKILTSDGEKMVQSAVKQLYRAIMVIKFVCETADIKEILELQGHLWSMGAENRSLTYRGHKFCIHRITL